MSKPHFYPQYAERRLAEALEDSPVVLIHGPRQCGKTTLAQFAYAPDYLHCPGVGEIIWPGNVIERGSQAVAGVEVKGAATVTRSDFRGLSKLATAAGERFVRGVVLYDGETSARFGDRLYAVPIRRLWETP